MKPTKTFGKTKISINPHDKTVKSIIQWKDSELEIIFGR